MKGVARKTAISWAEADNVRIRGYSIADLIGHVSFGSAIYLLLTGELPAEPVGRLMEAIFVSVLDHGPTPASTLAACTVASAGAPLSSSVAAGILAIAKHHGGAVEDCMVILERAVRMNLKPEEAAAQIAIQYRELGRRVPGFGHRQHRNDPRTARLLLLAESLSLSGACVVQARAIEFELSRRAGKPLPLNVDGAIASLLCDIGFPLPAANGIFMIARVPGLIAHSVEEQARNSPLAPISPDAYEYDGPPNRKLRD